MKKTIADFLIEEKLIDPVVLDSLKREAGKKKRDLTSLILEKKLVKEEDLFRLKGKLLKVPFRSLEGEAISLDVLREIPLEVAQHYQFVPIGVDEEKKILEVGMVKPEDIGAREALKFITLRRKLSPKVYIITPTDFEYIIKQYRTLRGEVEKALEELAREIRVPKKIEKERIEKLAEEAPVTRVVALILKHAIDERASDVHIEPGEKSVRVRFRIDGVLHINLILPLSIHPAVVSRIKILSNLRIDETRIPQDGRFFTTIGARKVDFRVSTFPTSMGEKVVMRILDPAIGLKDLPALGLEGRNLKVLKEAIQKPYGMILITGPTGCGKTTTLYAILNILNQEGVNIVSLEDPIEYYIEGVNQSQVRPDIGYTFATGLRHILRQDPDKVMVGEIRDSETAKLAVHAALTGHLVLSTLHTNNAIGVIPRLIDMGIDPYLIPPTLILAVAQRLTRRLCPESKREAKLTPEIQKVIEKELAEISEEEKKALKIKPPYKMYYPLPSRTCPQGAKGRIAIFEILAMTPELEKIILEAPSEANIKKEAERQGMITMTQDGLLKTLRGFINFEEVLKEVEE